MVAKLLSLIYNCYLRIEKFLADIYGSFGYSDTEYDVVPIYRSKNKNLTNKQL